MVRANSHEVFYFTNGTDAGSATFTNGKYIWLSPPPDPGFEVGGVVPNDWTMS